MPIHIAGAGCCLLDTLYPDIDFASPAFALLRSRFVGDGGLSPGRLSFPEELERFLAQTTLSEPTLISAAKKASAPEAEGQNTLLKTALQAVTGGKAPEAENIGGPSAVSLIHASQMLGNAARVEYRGLYGDDKAGERLVALLRRTPLRLDGYRRGRGATPSTTVLSDPRWDSGRGERCFINDIGAASDFKPETLDGAFYSSDIVALGGSALVPSLHDALPEILQRAHKSGALTLVNTVFDFRNERRDPVGAWPLGPRPAAQEFTTTVDLFNNSDIKKREIYGETKLPGPTEAYANCDLLIADRDEAIRLSGERNLYGALGFLSSSGVGAFLVTRGGDSVLAWAGGGRFAPIALSALPVSALADKLVHEERAAGRRQGDTTGCGDAFAGGVIAALAEQIAAGRRRLDLLDAAVWGIAAGAATLFVLGGVHYEKSPGEKREAVERFRADWLERYDETKKTTL